MAQDTGAITSPAPLNTLWGALSLDSPAQLGLLFVSSAEQKQRPDARLCSNGQQGLRRVTLDREVWRTGHWADDPIKPNECQCPRESL